MTLAALRAGRLDERRARVIADGTRVLAQGVRKAVEAAIVPLAETRVSSRVQDLLDRAVIAADPDAAAALEKQARSERSVQHRPGRHGVGHVNATLPAEGAAAVFTLLDLLAQATAHPDDDRGIDARRADALVDVCTELLACGRLDLTRGDPAGGGVGEQPDNEDAISADRAGDGSERPDHPVHLVNPSRAGDTGGTRGPGCAGESGGANGTNDTNDTNDTSDTVDAVRPSRPSESARAWRGLSRHGRRPHLSVTVGLSTLAGLDRLPGHLAGHGAITAELAATIAQAAGTINLIGVHPQTGTAAAVSQTVYRARQQVSDQIMAAAGTCRFPSCNQPAWRCDTDHRTSFDHEDPQAGGLTRLWDCDPECRRHHLLKTHTQWRVTGGPGGDDDPTLAWTSPTGHRYLDRPREFAIPGEEIDLRLAEVFAPARRQAPPTPPVDTGESRDEDDLHRIDAIRRRIEKLRWDQRRRNTLARLSILRNPHAASEDRGAAPASAPGIRTAPSAATSAVALLVADDLGMPAIDDQDSSGTRRGRAHDPDYRACLYLEGIARTAAGRPDDPPPF